MSFLDFPEDLYVKVLDTGEVSQMGSVQVPKSGELTHVRVLIHVRGTLAGSERVRVVVFSDSGYLKRLYESDWSTLPYSDWIGWIRCDFARKNLNPNLTYYMGLEIGNYTRNGDTFYVGQPYDHPWPIYSNGSDNFHEHPLAMQIFSYGLAE